MPAPYKYSMRRAFTPLSLAVATLLQANIAAADNGKIEEVTVTAEKRSETLQNTPIAMTAMTAETLSNKGITSYEGIAQATPSITFTPYPSSSNTLILFMRGQGVADPQQITQDGAVGLYVDGIYISRPQAATFDLADVERVEVLRGPQGTLYGRNTTGGAVNIISKKPSGEFAFKEDFSYGTLGKIRSLTTVDLPKWNDISVKFAYLRSKKDGFVENKRGPNASNNNDYDYESQNAGRLAVRWQPLDAFSADYALETGRLDSTPIYYQNPFFNGQTILSGYTYAAKNSRMTETYRSVDLPLSDAEYQGHTLTLSYDIDDATTLKSLTGYRDLHSDAYQDYAEAFGSPYRTYDRVDSHQFSQELQLVGSLLQQQRIKYVAGLYYFKESSSHFENLLASANFAFDKDRDVSTEATSLAQYAQVTWTPPLLDDRMDITVGERFTKDKRDAERRLSNNFNFPPIGFAENSDTFSRFNPSLTLGYRWTDDLNTYLKATTGYKAGGSSEATRDFTQTFKPEEITSYEFGFKSYWLDRRVRANGAVFYSKLKDMQMAFPDNNTDPSIVLALNAGKATISGAELELLLMPIDDVTLSLDYTYLDTRVDKVDAPAGTVFTTPPSPYASGDDIAERFHISNAPRHKLAAAADYTFLHFAGGDLSVHLDYRWSAAYFGTQPTGSAVPGRDFYQYDAYGVLDARLNLALNDHIRVGLWGKNVLNKAYQTFVIGTGDPVGGYYANSTAWSEPASYGVDISYRY